METGDSRLAFLIGHELAHLAKDDFWHGSAFAAVSSYKDETQVRRILTSQLEKTGGSLDFVKTQELQADSYGIIYMTMAGYDPKAIIVRMARISFNTGCPDHRQARLWRCSPRIARGKGRIRPQRTSAGNRRP